jgi:hypothetical protein
MRAVERTKGLVSYAATDKLARRYGSRFMVRVRVRSEHQASIERTPKSQLCCLLGAAHVKR